jgi:hypothetical protein
LSFIFLAKFFQVWKIFHFFILFSFFLSFLLFPSLLFPSYSHRSYRSPMEKVPTNNTSSMTEPPSPSRSPMRLPPPHCQQPTPPACLLPLLSLSDELPMAGHGVPTPAMAALPRRAPTKTIFLHGMTKMDAHDLPLAISSLNFIQNQLYSLNFVGFCFLSKLRFYF